MLFDKVVYIVNMLEINIARRTLAQAMVSNVREKELYNRSLRIEMYMLNCIM